MPSPQLAISVMCSEFNKALPPRQQYSKTAYNKDFTQRYILENEKACKARIKSIAVKEKAKKASRAAKLKEAKKAQPKLKSAAKAKAKPKAKAKFLSRSTRKKVA